MTFVEFTQVVLRPVDGDQVQVIHMKRSIAVDHVCSLQPGVVPSSVAGPHGAPVGKPATYILMANGEKILVEELDNEVLWRLAHDPMEIKEPVKEDLDPDSSIIQ